MIRFSSFYIIFLLLLTHPIYAGRILDPADIFIVPKPLEMKIKAGQFTVNEKTFLLISENDIDAEQVARFFISQLQLAGGPNLKVSVISPENKNAEAILLSISRNKSSIPAEGYELKVSPKQIRIHASDGAGLLYGIQTLLQLFPPEICKVSPMAPGKSWAAPCVEIKDHPRYSYRGMHLDVSRHFFPKEFIKRYLDLMAMYKFNTFHWHLTDDNGWRIEIKKYPGLIQTAAWRVDHENLPWNSRPAQQTGDKASYGGYYTQDDIREIVQYAAERYITIIPEIEMPAHSVEVLAAYPRLSCTGGPFTVPPGKYWPNSDIFCAGNDSVFTFLEDVLTEVMALFPSPYIHVGGDEADKTNWKKCPKCLARIKAEGLKDETELQSYFIKRMEKFIVSKGRKLIGWDEILEGGLPPEATVMSWRGTEGGIAAARQGHDAIMTPGAYCYFDHYQADPQSEPKAIGGFTTLKKVYGYEPRPGELTDEEAKHILGAQGNVWTEFIPSFSQVEYMAVPRMIALSEVLWSPKSLRNWSDFRSRMEIQYKRLDYMIVNYSKGSFKVEISTLPDPKTNKEKIYLSSEQGNLPIYYTLDGTEPSLQSSRYESPIEIVKNTDLKAAMFPDGKPKEKSSSMLVIFHKAIGKPVKYLQTYSDRYPAGGATTLTDGLRGSSQHRDGFWQGYLGNDCEVVIDLGKIMPVQSVTATFLQDPDKWIFLPSIVEYSLARDGKTEIIYNDKANTMSPRDKGPFIQPFGVFFPEGVTARYLTIKAKNLGKCPSWHEGAGEPCWLFIDEITVY